MIRIFIICIVLVFLSACSSVKDGLTLKKKSGADEFLVEKKNPLVLPPDFDILPSPDENMNNQETDPSNEIEELLSKNKDKTQSTNSGSISDKIEQNILNKIKTK
tara:strand:- start:554 stop:868 length:315 start_codon:yes stop_codon:yes gene_type:complete